MGYSCVCDDCSEKANRILICNGFEALNSNLKFVLLELLLLVHDQVMQFFKLLGDFIRIHARLKKMLKLRMIYGNCENEHGRYNWEVLKPKSDTFLTMGLQCSIRQYAVHTLPSNSGQAPSNWNEFPRLYTYKQNKFGIFLKLNKLLNSSLNERAQSVHPAFALFNVGQPNRRLPQPVELVNFPINGNVSDEVEIVLRLSLRLKIKICF